MPKGKSEKTSEFKKASGFSRNDTKNAIRSEKDRHKICFQCRKRGHAVQSCPLRNASDTADKKDTASRRICCYACGSTKHPLKNCQKYQRGDPLPFASCFVCNQQGHLASACSQNVNGLYPDGGGCRFCGENLHLAKDCPSRKPSKNAFKKPEDRWACSELETVQGGDDDYQSATLRRPSLSSIPAAPKKKKVVTF